MTPPRIYVRPAKRGYVWHFVRGGRITANGEVFTRQADAVRAVRNVIRGLCGIFGVPVAIKVKRLPDGILEVVPVVNGYFWPTRPGEAPKG